MHTFFCMKRTAPWRSFLGDLWEFPEPELLDILRAMNASSPVNTSSSLL